MKNKRISLKSVVLWLVVIICASSFLMLSYIVSLRRQNSSLQANVDASIANLTEAVRVLESDQKIKELIALRQQNILLRRQVKELEEQLSRLSAGQKPAKAQRAGNRGFLIKGGKAD